MTNEYERTAREVKANKLADAMIDAYQLCVGGTDSWILDAIGENNFVEDWRWLADTAGVPEPSEQTIDLTYALIRRRLSAAVLDDPFEGLLG